MSEQNPPLPDGGPRDGVHEGEPAPEEYEPDSETKSQQGTADTTEDGALSPGSTASGSPTSLGE